MPQPPPDRIVPARFNAPAGGAASPRFRWHPLHGLALLAALVLAAALLFIFNARAIVVASNASDPQVRLSGAALPIGGGRFLLLRGSYRLDISAAGYHPQQQRIEVTADSPANLHIALEPLPGQIRAYFASAGIEGQVALEGSEPGAAANQFTFVDLPAGSYRLHADAPLYRPATFEVEVRGRGLTEELPIELAPNWGYLAIEVEPATARLTADDQPLTKDPTRGTYRIEQGTPRLQITAPGYKSWQQPIEIRAGTTLEWPDTLRLKPQDIQVPLSTRPADVAVTLNGNYLGQTPLQLPLTPGQEHELQLHKAGYQSQRHRITAPAAGDGDGNAKPLAYTLKPNLVDVRVSLHPANARLYVNGADQGTAVKSLQLPAVRQQIRVTAPGHAAKTLDFLPLTGSAQLLQVRLLTDEAAAWARIPARYQNKVGATMRLFSAAGLVAMGTSRREPNRRANEAQWQAQLNRPFYLSATETTNRQYRQFAATHSSGHFESHSLDGPDQPAVRLSWQQAALFCNWLSKQAGLPPFYQTQKGAVSGSNPESTGYRLPTEAEWTFAASTLPAGPQQRYIWGDADAVPGPVANFADQSIAAKIRFVVADINDGHPAAAAVASFAPNARGLYDLGGNVMEWMHDWYQPVPYSGADPVADPLGPAEGEFHVIRGASWARGHLPQLRLAYRDYDSKGRQDLGFRVARYAK